MHNVQRLTALLLVLALASTAQHNAHAQHTRASTTTSKAKLAVFNAALTGALTLGRGALEGEVEDWPGALRAFSVGALGGYGFYQSKRLAGGGNAAAGLALGYASASAVENAAQGRHPLSRLRFGIGGLDLRLRTPFANSTEAAQLTLELNALWIVSFAALLPRSQAVLFKGGMPAHLLPSRNGRPYASAIGRLVVLHEGYDDVNTSVVEHEAVHVLQHLQASALTPHYRLSRLLGHSPLRLGEQVSADLQIDWLYGALALIDSQKPYAKRWSEIEAYTLAPNSREYWWGGVGTYLGY